jgi:hypothetical protein
MFVGEWKYVRKRNDYSHRLAPIVMVSLVTTAVTSAFLMCAAGSITTVYAFRHPNHFLLSDPPSISIPHGMSTVYVTLKQLSIFCSRALDAQVSHNSTLKL